MTARQGWALTNGYDPLERADVAHRSYYNGTVLTTNAIPFSSSPLGTVLRVDHKCDAGEQTTQSVVVTVLDSDFEVAASASGPWGSSANIGVVGATNVPSYHRQIARKPVGTAALAAFNVLYGNVEAVPVAPAFISGPTVSEVANTSARIVATWSDANSGDTVTAKRIVKTSATAPTSGEWAAAALFDGDEIVTGLTGTTTYRVWVQLTDSTGLSTVSSVVTFTTAADTTAPAWPGGNASLSVTAGASSFLIDFADAIDSVGVTAYEVSRSDNGTSGWAVIANPTSSAFTDDNGGSGYANGVTKYFRVRARDAAGNWSTYSSIVSATTVAANTAPTFSTAPRVKSGSVTSSGFTLEWGMSDAESDSITVKLSIDGGASYSAISPTLNGTTGLYEYSRSGLSAGTTYNHLVRLEDATHAGSAGSTSSNVAAATSEVARTDNFNDSALDTTTLWDLRKTAGATATESGTTLALGSPTTADGWLLYRKTALDLSATKSYKWKWRVDSEVSWDTVYPFAVEDFTAPFAPGASNSGTSQHTLSYNTSATSGVYQKTRLNAFMAQSNNQFYLNRGTSTSGGTNRFYNFTTNTWGTTSVNITVTPDTFYVCVFETRNNAGTNEWRFTLKSADESTVLGGTDWQTWAGITPFANSAWLVIAQEPYTNGLLGQMTLDWYDEA